jgi:guanosine-3',5'-bis(diphosphate) 3'-pyrophosphohydrolase
MSDLVKRARQFAIERHGEQKRKYTGEPYWHHLRDVAAMSMADTPQETEHAKAVAWLHDTLEDTPTTYDEIHHHFGKRVADDVETLTDRGKPGVDGNRATRKAAYNDKIKSGSHIAHTVKAADLISNSHSIAKHDPKFSKTYFKEKGETLQILDKAHPKLLGAAKNLLNKINARSGNVNESLTIDSVSEQDIIAEGIGIYFPK